jgi:hypothetical protein
MSERVRVIEADGKPARDDDGLHERGEIWYLRLKVDGEWREFSSHAANYNAARKVRQDNAQALAHGRLPAEMAKWPLSKALEAWCDSRTQSTSAGTQALECCRGKALARHFPVRTLDEITAGGIRAYQSARRQAVAAATVNSEIRLLRGVLKRAKLWAFLADEVKLLREPA